MDTDETLRQVTQHLDRMSEIMERVVQTQVQHAGDLIETRQILERMARNQLELAERQTRQQDATEQLSAIVMVLAEDHRNLKDELREQFKEVSDQIRELTEGLQQTRGNVNALVKIVDGLIRGGDRQS